MSKYEDIINLTRPKSKREKMSINDRASQFAPFSALTGYEDKVIEASRLTDKERYIDDDKKERISKRINLLGERIYDRIQVEIIYFVKDLKKEGGSYKKVNTIIKKIDLVNKRIILEDKTIIYIKDIVELNSKIFD